MKYKVGDKVKVKDLERLIKEYGEDLDGNIITPLFCFFEGMRWLCGKTVTIKKVYDDYYTVVEDTREFRWNDDMFERQVFERGDKIEVSDDGYTWHTTIFAAYIEGAISPYCAVLIADAAKKFYSGEKFRTLSYKYARSLQDSIVLDGKEVKISKRTYYAIKDIAEAEV